MGNCFSSSKDPSDTGNQNRVNNNGNDPGAVNTAPGASPSNFDKAALNNYTMANMSKNDASPSSSSGSTASPLSNIPNTATLNSSGTNNQLSTTNNTSNDNDQHNNNNTTTTSSNTNSFTNASNDSKGRQDVKILLLGSGESGKSTILKQMKIIHQNGYSQEDLLMYKTTIYKNLLDCAKSIVSALEQFGYTFEENKQETAQATLPDPTDNDTPAEDSGNTAVTTTTAVAATKDNEIIPADLEFIKASIISPDPDTFFDSKLAAIISKLWANPIVKKIFTEQRAQFYIMDSAPYFFSNVDRISDPDYIPNVADILRARIKTTGIYETRFEMGKLNIHMFDVGGQRSERRKWINCFDNVTLIIFCVALSEYDQVLLEESSQNRMAESLVLFDSIINSRWFARTSVVLFLNKIDVFTEKLAYSPLKDYFPDYTGGDDIKNAAKYILWRFNKLNRNQVTIYPHLTQATDTSNIRVVFAAVKETILQNSLRDSGIL
ncbi:hypothetical protein D0Z00_000731 [Geotrichum galactomycetum]|uniref:Uncharacterized protein n=1 Tax=Geotrichum galactomycetum TaxID=27317 RepID=A0ACB6V911_9ASCO|nr:hypothetical protein D0Z00_000731 [Geotrichum candidum]